MPTLTLTDRFVASIKRDRVSHIVAVERAPTRDHLYTAFTHLGDPIRFPNLRITRGDG